MATIPRSFIDNFTQAVNALSDDAKDKLAKALSKVDDTVTFDALVEIMETLLAPYTESAAAVAATFYDGLRDWFGISDGFYAVSEGMREPYITSGTVNKVMEGKSVVSLSEDMQTALLNQLDYEIRRTANLTIERNAKRDPKKPKWARVPQVTITTYAPWSKKTGVTHDKFLAMTGTCMFCTMLASRGFAYHTAETAAHAHPDCNCRVVPSWDKGNPSVEGYDKDLYYDMWKHPEKYEKNELSEDARYYQTVADDLNKKALKQEERALRRMENDYNFMVEALGSGRSYSKIEAFYQGADEAYFKAQMIKAKENGIREAIVLNPSGDREFFGRAEINAAKEFAADTVELPKNITGKSTASTPRIADMRGYFNKDGNPINFNARDGGYDSWKTWGKAFADKEKKRRYGR